MEWRVKHSKNGISTEFETSNQQCKFRNYMKSWVDLFPKFNSRGGVVIRMSWPENFGKIN